MMSPYESAVYQTCQVMPPSVTVPTTLPAGVCPWFQNQTITSAESPDHCVPPPTQMSSAHSRSSPFVEVGTWQPKSCVSEAKPPIGCAEPGVQLESGDAWPAVTD